MATAELPSDQSDDFEIISPSLDQNLSVVPSLAVASHHFESAPTCPAFETETAFVLVQNTQQLKEELLKQQSDLAHGLEKAKKDKEEQDKHLADITSQLTDLEAENMCVKAENMSLRAQLQPFDEAREKVDELTAQLCQSQDVIKNQEQIIRQFQCEGFVSVQPPMLTDQMLAQELSDKDSCLKELQDRVEQLQENLLKEQERSRKFEQDNEENKGLITVLNEQRNEDSTYIEEVRAAYERQLAVVRDQMRGVQGTLNGQQMQQPMVPPPQLPSNPDVITCPRCNIRVCDHSLYMRHIEQCRPSVDQID